VHAKTALFVASTPIFFLIIATGVFDRTLVVLGEYFSSFLRVRTSRFDDAVRKEEKERERFSRWEIEHMTQVVTKLIYIIHCRMVTIKMMKKEEMKKENDDNKTRRESFTVFI
jgi:hypothetical protein